VPYLRLTADRRGVEHTFLLHVPAPGQPPRVLYWYRTAPGLRVGRPALDDQAMRSLEEQYPDIDFDWPYILDVGAMTPVEVEAPLPPRKRKPRPLEPEPDAETIADEAAAAIAERADSAAAEDRAPREAPEPTEPDLLSELLGRGIAASLRGRVAEVAALVAASTADSERRAAWETRLASIDPDGWTTAEAVLAGMGTIDRDLAALKAEVDAGAAEPR
jgi:hypothetical protein